MITEDYVSFEVARLLKEKGFPQEYDIYHALVYNEEDYEDEYETQRMVLETKLVKAGTLSSYPVGVPEPKCYCCTLQMAMKWFREVHHIHIRLAHADNESYKYEIYPRKGKYIGCCFWDMSYYETYEKAAEVALKYCLEKLI